ncbi:MAG TPA: DUF3300 domain-containing protein [Verrucomicrobiae bacterium]|nr:DUF3300 domain-containing protein [Verrucomicrobiae bacterium]
MFTHPKRVVVSVAASILAAVPAFAQAPPVYAPGQMDQIVARIALYPDPLLAQVLAASTYPNDIPAAAQWADQHHYLTGQALAAAISADQLPWDPSVQALLPFPSVLEMMAADPNWTAELGNAFLASQPAVMDAVQRQRALASRYGYLRTNPQVIVGTGPYITILPVNPAFVVVPAYDPAVVFFAPRPGFFVGGAIRFGFGITVGGFFGPWGWGGAGIRFDWGAHSVWVNNVVWNRTWVNRAVYVHPGYASFHRPGPNYVRPAESHALEPRTQVERNAAHEGRTPPREDHHGRGR